MSEMKVEPMCDSVAEPEFEALTEKLESIKKVAMKALKHYERAQQQGVEAHYPSWAKEIMLLNWSHPVHEGAWSEMRFPSSRP